MVLVCHNRLGGRETEHDDGARDPVLGSPTMENQMEEKMENEMETGVI